MTAPQSVMQPPPCMRLPLAIACLIPLGCGSHALPPHTLLYAGDRETNVWSYAPVVGEGHVSRQLRPGERVVLDGGAVVTLDGGAVSVNGNAVTRRNAVVSRDGRVREGAFIRTFD